MTPIKTITLAAAAALLCSDPAFAASGQGTSAFQFLQLGVGARPSALGETYAGVAGGVNSIYWNPAGLAGLERGELSMTHALWLEGVTYSNIAYGRPALGGTLGAAFNILNTGDIQEADNTGLRLEDNYSMSDLMGILSYSRGWDGLALGVNLKHISSRLEAENAHAYAVDLGALYTGFRPWGKPLGLGLSVQNAGTKAKYVSEEDPLPVIVRAGGSLQLFKDLLLASDLDYTEKKAGLHAGVEYTHKLGAAALALRAGYKSDTVGGLGALSGLTAGMGINWHDLQLDYAWNSFTDLGITHRISVGIKFDAPYRVSYGGPDRSDKRSGAPSRAALPAASSPADSGKDSVPDALDSDWDGVSDY